MVEGFSMNSLMVFEASAVGNCIVKSPFVEVLSPPNAKIQTAGSPEAESLNIIAPLAVIVAELKVKSAKSVNAVVPEVDGSTLVSEPPLAV